MLFSSFSWVPGLSCEFEAKNKHGDFYKVNTRYHLKAMRLQYLQTTVIARIWIENDRRRHPSIELILRAMTIMKLSKSQWRTVVSQHLIRKPRNIRRHNDNHDRLGTFWILISNSMRSAQFSIISHNSQFTSLQILLSPQRTPITSTHFKPDKLNYDIVHAIKRCRISSLSASFINTPPCSRFFEQIFIFDRSPTSINQSIAPHYGSWSNPRSFFPEGLRPVPSPPAPILTQFLFYLQRSPDKLYGFCIHLTNRFSFLSNLRRQYPLCPHAAFVSVISSAAGELSRFDSCRKDQKCPDFVTRR